MDRYRLRFINNYFFGVIMAKILVVDDEVCIVDLITDYLECAGHQVLSAGDGDEALEIYRRESPDLVVSDIFMPRMNGIELADLIKKDNPDYPVMLITGYDPDVEHHADVLLEKPFNIHSFIDNVKSLLEKKPDYGAN